MGLEPTKMRQKVSLCLIKFSECEKKIILRLSDFSNWDFMIQNLQLYEYKVKYLSGHDFKAFKGKLYI